LTAGDVSERMEVTHVSRTQGASQPFEMDLDLELMAHNNNKAALSESQPPVASAADVEHAESERKKKELARIFADARKLLMKLEVAAVKQGV